MHITVLDSIYNVMCPYCLPFVSLCKIAELGQLVIFDKIKDEINAPWQ